MGGAQTPGAAAAWAASSSEVGVQAGSGPAARARPRV